MTIRKIFTIVGIGVMVTSLFSCNGIFDSIYDNGSPKLKTIKTTGFISTPTHRSPGEIFIDATSYQEWHYVNLEKQTIDTYNIVTKEGVQPKDWDFAVHRYDFKTNDGSALETKYSDMLPLMKNPGVIEGNFTKDEFFEKKLIVSMEHMMDTGPDYVPSNINTVLGTWLKVDTSKMPPEYTLSHKVYILKLKNGKEIALQMPSFKNGKDKKGFITINYFPMK